MRFIVVEILNRMFRATPHATQLIVTGINCYLRQPRLERCFMSAVISAESKVGLGEAVLDDLFNLFALREKAAANASYLAAVTLEQMLEGRFVARGGGGDQCVICPLYE